MYGLSSRDSTDSVAWWWSQKSAFLLLSQPTLDILTIPALAANTQRTFSAVKGSLISQPQSTKPEVPEELQCRRSGFQSGGIQLSEAMVGLG